MTAEFVRDAAATAAIFGFFASCWFGWAQENPPQAWKKWLVAGAVASVLTAVAGAFLAWRHWSDGTVFDEGTSRTFGIVVGVECAAAGIGAAVLAVRQGMHLVAAWIAFVVGVHFFPLAVLLHYPLLYATATLVTLAAVAAVPLARTGAVQVSAVTGVATGTLLVATGWVSLATVLV